MGFPIHRRSNTLRSASTDARLKADSILENSVHDTDAEGATGGNTPISQAKGQNNHSHYGSSRGVVFLLCGGLSALAFFDFCGFLSIFPHTYS